MRNGVLAIIVAVFIFVCGSMFINFMDEKYTEVEATIYDIKYFYNNYDERVYYYYYIEDELVEGSLYFDEDEIIFGHRIGDTVKVTVLRETGKPIENGTLVFKKTPMTIVVYAASGILALAGISCFFIRRD